MIRRTPLRPPLYLVSNQEAIRQRMKVRMLQTLLRLTLFALLTVCAIGVFTSPRFAIQHIRIRGAERVDEDAVRLQAAHLLGSNLLRASLAQFVRRVKDIPQVKEVTVRRWPAWPVSTATSLTVEITEREPAFAMESNGDFFLADSEGKIFDAQRKTPPIPIVWLEGVLPHVGNWISRERLDAVMMILNESRAAGAPRISRVLIDREGFASLRLHDRTLVRLGDEQWSRKLHWLPTALLTLRDKSRPAEYIDITAPEAPIWKPAPSKRNKERDLM